MQGEPFSGDLASDSQKKEIFKFRLFIAGNTIRSINAVSALKKICQENLIDRCQVEIIDIYQQPELARENQIIATPTLIKYTPAPKKIMVGDLSKSRQVLTGLGLA